MPKVLIFFVVGCLSSSLSYAAPSAEGGGAGLFKFGKNSSLWLVGGGGTMTPGDPLRDQLGYTNHLAFMAGGDLSLLGPFYLSIAAKGKWSSGKMSYDYTDANSAHYTAKDVSVTQTSSGADFGLQIRLANGNSGHLFIEGGGYYETWNLNYDLTKATNISSGGVTPPTSETGIGVMGTYAKAGIDLILAKGYGLRIFGRAGKGSTAKIQALANQSMSYVEGEGYAGFNKQF